jgi:transposase
MRTTPLDLHAEIPRVECPTHGVKQVRVSWAEPRSRFTLLLERLIIDLIRQCSTVKGACEIVGVSWDEAWGVMSRAVARGRARNVGDQRSPADALDLPTACRGDAVLHPLVLPGRSARGLSP